MLRSTPDPDLDVLSLCLADLTFRRCGQVVQVAVLNPDQVGFAQREVEVEVDQPVERVGRRCRSLQHAPGAREQPRADADEQFDQKRFLVGEVAVDRGAADSGRGPDVLEPHGEEPAFGHQSLGGGDEL